MSITHLGPRMALDYPHGPLRKHYRPLPDRGGMRAQSSTFRQIFSTYTHAHTHSHFGFLGRARGVVLRFLRNCPLRDDADEDDIVITSVQRIKVKIIRQALTRRGLIATSAQLAPLIPSPNLYFSPLLRSTISHE
ncbi:hypothetical protein FRC15_001424 [Serendipita sp. 397]|nr:hypothetical protein FRC15_001424 [Serendipita sp. 397]